VRRVQVQAALYQILQPVGAVARRATVGADDRAACCGSLPARTLPPDALKWPSRRERRSAGGAASPGDDGVAAAPSAAGSHTDRPQGADAAARADSCGTGAPRGVKRQRSEAELAVSRDGGSADTRQGVVHAAAAGAASDASAPAVAGTAGAGDAVYDSAVAADTLRAESGPQDTVSVLGPVADSVLLRWQHLEPVAMDLFESYRGRVQLGGSQEPAAVCPEATQCCAPPPAPGPAAAAAAAAAHAHSSRMMSGGVAEVALAADGRTRDGPCGDALLRGSGTLCAAPPAAPAARGARRTVRRMRDTLPALALWLQAVSADLQAVSRFRWLEVVAAVQHEQETGRVQPSRRMVSSVALDNRDHILAVVGMPLRTCDRASRMPFV
jgi:hypothetical protein